MRRRYLIILLFGTLLFSAGSWLIATQSGLRWGAARLQASLPLTLGWDSLEGKLIGPIDIRGLKIDMQGQQQYVAHLALDWKAWQLLFGYLHVQYLQIDGIDIHSMAANTTTEPLSFDLRLPLNLRVDKLAIQSLVLHGSEGEPLSIDSINGQHLRLWRNARVDHLAVKAPWGEVTSKGRVGLSPTQPVKLEVEWSLHLPEMQPLAGSGTLEGTLETLGFVQQLTQPLQARIHGEVSPLLPVPRFRLASELEHADLQALDPAWPAIQLEQVQIEAEGTAEAIQLHLDQHILSAEYGQWQGVIAASYQADRLIIDSLSLHDLQGDAILRGYGELALHTDGTPPSFSAELDWEKAQWPLTGVAQVFSPTGGAQISGRAEAYQIGLKGDVGAPQLPLSSWKVEALGTQQGMLFERIEGQLLDGRVLGTGELTWAPQLRWTAKLEGSALNPALAWSDWPGQLHARINSSGVLTEKGLQASMDLASLSGRLRNYPLEGKAGVRIDGSRYQLQGLRLQSGDNSITADLALQEEQLSGSWQLRAAQIAQLLPQGQGAMNVAGKIAGTLSATTLDVELDGKALAYGPEQLDSLAGRVHVDLGDQSSSHLSLRGTGLNYQGQAIKQLVLQADGVRAKHSATLAIQAMEPNTIDLQINGSWLGTRWEGQVTQGKITSDRLGRWILEKGLALTASPGQFETQPFCWRSGEASLCADANWRVGKQLQANAKISRLPLALFDVFIPQQAVEINGLADADLALHQDTLGNTFSLDASVSSSDGELRYRVGDVDEKTAYRSINLKLIADKSGSRVESLILLPNSGRLSAKANLPDWIPTAVPSPSQPLAGQLELSVSDLSIVPILIPEIQSIEGRIEGRIKLAGSKADPSFDGFVQLDADKVILWRPGLEVKSLSARATSTAQGELNLVATAQSGEGQLRLNGGLETDRKGKWHVVGRLNGENFTVLRIPQAQVTISPDVSVDATPSLVTLRGVIDIPRADIQLATLPAGVQTSPDVVIVNREEAVPASKVDAELIVRMGDAVKLSGYGFKGRLEGRLVVEEKSGKSRNINGNLQIVDGQYGAYGKELFIEQGRLLFFGPAVDNPGIDLRAVRYIEDIRAGVHVTGRLQRPELRLYSEPSLDDANILSYVVLGRPLQQASAAEGDTLYKAASALSLAGGELIAKRIGSRFGIEEVALESESNGGQESVNVVLGTYLTPSIYVRYVVRVGETLNSWRLNYTINQHWSLETETGVYSGADILYTIEP